MPLPLETMTIMMLDEIRSRVFVPDHNQPKLLTIGGPCRTATGALATVLGRALEVKFVHIQALKAFGRNFFAQKSGHQSITPLEFLKSELSLTPGNHVEIDKNTFGPDPESPAEFIDQIEIFIDHGMRPENMIFIPTSRDPFETVISWAIMWGWKDLQTFPFTGFNRSFEFTLEMTRKAQKLGIKVVPAVFDLARDNETGFIKNIFEETGLTFTDSVLTWGDEDAYFTKTVKYDKPPKKWIKGALGKASGGRGAFKWEPIKQIFTPEEIVFLAERIQPAMKAHQELLAWGAR